MGFITSDRSQNIIFGYCLDEFVEKESKCRYILKIIDKLDLRELYNRYSNQGAEAYEPKLMLSIWFLAYCEGITSTRKLENACKKNLDFIYISGNLRPDHTTLSRFMQKNMDLWGNYFLQIVQLSKKMNLSDFKEIAIDGTKIIAHSSKKKSMREPKLDKYIEGIRHDIKVYSEEVEKEDSLDRKQELNQKISECKTKETQLLERKEEIKKRKENLQPKDRENHQINIEEPEALMMSLAQGGYAPGYNGQIAVDNQSRLIVTQELVQDRNDEKQFSRQYEQVENNLGMDKERKYIADGGYSSLSQTEFVKTNDIDAYIADPKLKNYKEESIEVIQQEEKKLNRLDFKYDEENDCYHCPMGESLEFIGTDAVGRSYRSKDCSQCPIKHQCLGKNNTSGQRKILRDHREESAEQMRNKMMTPEGVSMMMLRQTTVEPVFGNIKENLGYRRFRRKGLKNAKGEFALFCLVHNINRLYMLVLFYFIIKIRALKIKNVLERILITPQNKTVVYNRFNEVRIQIWELISTLLLDTGYATASVGGMSPLTSLN
jgi:transposase